MNAQAAQVVQVVQPDPYSCTRSSFRRWKEQRNNKEMVGPVGPAVPIRVPESPSTISDQFQNVEVGPAMDQLFTGKLTGEVPPTWTREGWVSVTRDRMSRTNCPDMRRRFREELAAIEPRVKPVIQHVVHTIDAKQESNGTVGEREAAP